MKVLIGIIGLLLSINVVMQYKQHQQIQLLQLSVTELTGQNNSYPSATNTRTLSELNSLTTENVVTIDVLATKIDKLLQLNTALLDQQPSQPEVQLAVHSTPLPEPGLPVEVQDVLAFGLMDAEAWQQMDKQIKAMDKAQNKKFWTEVFARMDSGELYLPEE